MTGMKKSGTGKPARSFLNDRMNPG